ncbi:proliferating cell nuclear antigen [Tulasnella sp. JGI-2019a]|nr:proliferating cell nuclear antigen [Tulasnella sp. JGI-2019a]KAG9001818.1 proliferating cell nuclear antigen [Tulasnella sp. JGI-2019a]KAG9033030.1 proliferating cell nuclear antigen [Tulasnella sp. JGI-2019a]
MIEAKMESAQTIKKLLEAIKELVTDANFEANDEGLKLQAMDNSHVALVSVILQRDAFIKFRCDRPMPLGVNLASLTKVIKCAKDDDTITLRANDDQDALHLTYEAKNTDRIAEYEMKLMDIDADSLGIPDTEYDATVKLSSAEFQRIVRDLSQLGESVRIDVTKEGVKFASDGEAANGSVLLKQSGGGRIERVGAGSKEEKKVKREEVDVDAEEEEDEDEDEADKKKKKKAKKEKEKAKVKKEKADGDEDEEMEEDDGGSIKDDEEEGSEAGAESEDGDDDDDEEGSGKKRKRSSKTSGSAKKKAKAEESSKTKGKGKKRDVDDDQEEGGATIHMNQHVSLTFSLKYLVNFAKSGSLSKTVVLMMSNDVPLLVQYDFQIGKIEYYLAPKIGDE